MMDLTQEEIAALDQAQRTAEEGSITKILSYSGCVGNFVLAIGLILVIRATEFDRSILMILILAIAALIFDGIEKFMLRRHVASAYAIASKLRAQNENSQ